MSEFLRQGDRVRVQVWRDAVVLEDSGPTRTKLKLDDSTTTSVANYNNSEIQLVQAVLPPKPPIGALVFGSPQEEFFRRVGVAADPLGFKRLKDDTWASWSTICMGPGSKRKDPIVYAPVSGKPAEVVGWLDTDGDYWQVDSDDEDQWIRDNGPSGPDRRHRRDVERRYGPVRPLIVDPTYVEEKK